MKCLYILYVLFCFLEYTLCITPQIIFSKKKQNLIKYVNIMAIPAKLCNELQKIPRKLKVLTSSTVESTILKLTMPSDILFSETEIDILTHKNLLNMREDVDYHDTIVRKLISKLSEFDWRIGAKSLLVFHELLHSSMNNELVDSEHSSLSYAQSYIERYEYLSTLIENRIRELKCFSNNDQQFGENYQRYESWLFMRSYAEYLKTLCELINRGSHKLLLNKRNSTTTTTTTTNSDDPQIKYLHDLLGIQGFEPILKLYNEFFQSAWNLLQSGKALQSAHQGSSDNINASLNAKTSHIQTQTTAAPVSHSTTTSSSSSSSSPTLYISLLKTITRNNVPSEVSNAVDQVCLITTLLEKFQSKINNNKIEDFKRMVSNIISNLEAINIINIHFEDSLNNRLLLPSDSCHNICIDTNHLKTTINHFLLDNSSSYVSDIDESMPYVQVNNNIHSHGMVDFFTK